MKQNRVISGAVAALVLAALLAGCGSTATGASSADSTPAATEAAGSEATAPTAEPQAEAALPDGVYTADFETDSSMFHTSEACNGKGTLTVENGVMTFHVSLASKKIVNLYPGLAADAEANKTAWLIPTVDTVTYADGTTEEVYGYDIPVEALDTDFQLAILGTKGTWYDHVVSVSNAVPAVDGGDGRDHLIGRAGRIRRCLSDRSARAEPLGRIRETVCSESRRPAAAAAWRRVPAHSHRIA